MRPFNRHIILAVAIVLAATSFSFAQSPDQNFPTPLTSNEISGTIKARDIGDSRLTTYFYQFGGEQGDVFVNVVTKNLDGDIDVFTADGLRPLTKIVVFSDAGQVKQGGSFIFVSPRKYCFECRDARRTTCRRRFGSNLQGVLSRCVR